MNIRHQLLALAVVFAVPTSPLSSQTPEGASSGEIERLTYDVRWSFINLGTVTITQTTGTIDGKCHSIARMAVLSNPSIPFLDLDFVHETAFQSADLQIDRETITTKSRPRTFYVHDAVNGSILMVDSLDGRECRRNTVSSPPPCYDVNTLLLYARRTARGNARVSLPTVIDYGVNPTEIIMTGECERIDVPAFEGTVRSRHFTGIAHWVGSSFAGMSGRFEGWVSDDDAAVPLRASVKILLGSIVLELASYERAGWNTAALSGHSPSIVDNQGDQR